LHGPTEGVIGTFLISHSRSDPVNLNHAFKSSSPQNVREDSVKKTRSLLTAMILVHPARPAPRVGAEKEGARQDFRRTTTMSDFDRMECGLSKVSRKLDPEQKKLDQVEGRCLGSLDEQMDILGRMEDPSAW